MHTIAQFSCILPTNIPNQLFSIFGPDDSKWNGNGRHKIFCVAKKDSFPLQLLKNKGGDGSGSGTVTAKEESGTGEEKAKLVSNNSTESDV